jgi:predicted N-acyltransferase
MTSLRIQTIQHIDEIDSTLWDALVDASGGSVMLRHAFLRAFESSGSVTPGTGWQPSHLLLWSPGIPPGADQLVAAIPLYAKGHSYGEFVFDWAWAEAYERHGLNYYPKWLAAVPFTPVPGPRLLTTEPYRQAAAIALLHWAKQSKLSSLHVLYTSAQDQQALCAAGCMPRTHTQFHWFNQNWQHFEGFLADLTQPKRKKIRAERRKVKQAGVSTKVFTGPNLTSEHWDFFYRCYANTYHQRGNKPYLTPEFFNEIGSRLAEHCVLALAYQHEEPIAAALLWLDTSHGKRRLYGRYWGALQHVDCLHFELAYYTPIEWAIENHIDVIEGGAQGEHKLARGFVPIQTQSAHWLAHPGFADAVDRYLEQERAGINAYTEGLNSPFRQEIGD